MQLRKQYRTTNKPQLRAEFQKAANECEAKGFTHFAEVNREMVALIDADAKAKAKAAADAEADLDS